jgi:hypothetical protein
MNAKTWLTSLIAAGMLALSAGSAAAPPTACMNTCLASACPSGDYSPATLPACKAKAEANCASACSAALPSGAPSTAPSKIVSPTPPVPVSGPIPSPQVGTPAPSSVAAPVVNPAATVAPTGAAPAGVAPSGLPPPTPGTLIQPPPRTLIQPPPGTLTQPPPRTLIQPPPGTLTQPPPGTLIQPPPGTLTQPPPGTLTQPPPGTLTQPPPGTLIQPPPGTLIQPPPGTLIQPPPGTLIQPPPVALTRPGSACISSCLATACRPGGRIRPQLCEASARPDCETRCPPAVKLTVSPGSVLSGSSVTVNWSSTNAMACNASGGWSGPKPIAGSATVGPLTGTVPLTLSCSGPTGSGSQTITVAAYVPGSGSGGVPGSGGAGLRGFVDLHTHPLANLGFGGKLLYGGVDIGAMLPADPDCKQTRLFDKPPTIRRAPSVDIALGHDNSTHGGWGTDNTCGDGGSVSGIIGGIVAGVVGTLTFGVGTIAEAGVVGGGYAGGQYGRQNFIHQFQQSLHANDPPDDAKGYPDFTNWPTWNDLTHQKMWVDWIQRAQWGGLRVMVALAVNNKTLADSASGPGDGPQDDRASADLQIQETKFFVGRHPGFMEIAYSSADVQRIVSQGRLAVILGVEIDDIGDMYLPIGVPATNEGAAAEIDRLYDEGVRYIFPIHLLDNKFGGTATYNDTFNLSNYRERGSYYALKCVSTATDQVDWRAGSTDPGLWIFMAVKLGVLAPSVPVPQCGPGMGMRNQQGLTPLGETALIHMMRRGMLIDIDHMSQESATMALGIANRYGYPLNSGHNGLRGLAGRGGLAPAGQNSERSFSAQTYRAIYKLHGMVGIGSANLDAYQWLQMYEDVIGAMETPTDANDTPAILAWRATGAFGTDTDGLEFGMPPPTNHELVACVGNLDLTCSLSDLCGSVVGRTCARYSACTAQLPAAKQQAAACAKQYPAVALVQYSGAFLPSQLKLKTWDYNVDGVAHYGLLPDFLVSVSQLQKQNIPGLAISGSDLINNNLMNGAEYFYETWAIAEQKSATVRPPSSPPPSPPPASAGCVPACLKNSCLPGDFSSTADWNRCKLNAPAKCTASCSGSASPPGPPPPPSPPPPSPSPPPATPPASAGCVSACVKSSCLPGDFSSTADWNKCKLKAPASCKASCSGSAPPP